MFKPVDSIFQLVVISFKMFGISDLWCFLPYKQIKNKAYDGQIETNVETMVGGA